MKIQNLPKPLEPLAAIPERKVSERGRPASAARADSVELTRTPERPRPDTPVQAPQVPTLVASIRQRLAESGERSPLVRSRPEAREAALALLVEP